MAKKVLLIDDAATVRLMQRKILEENGYEVAGEASNGMEGLEKYKNLKPDLTILDITMPGMDGMVTLKYLRQQSSDAKVVMCSGGWILANVVEALISGASDFVSKPFQRDRFIFSIENALERDGELDGDILAKLSAECEHHEGLVVSQDQISALISYVSADNAGVFTVGEILENLGFLYQDSAFGDLTGQTDFKFDKILKGQEKITGLLTQILEKLNK